MIYDGDTVTLYNQGRRVYAQFSAPDSIDATLNAAAEPPTGTSVPYLPDGYEEVEVQGTTYMKLGATYYHPYYEGDEVIYVVTKV